MAQCSPYAHLNLKREFCQYALMLPPASNRLPNQTGVNIWQVKIKAYSVAFRQLCNKAEINKKHVYESEDDPDK